MIQDIGGDSDASASSCDVQAGETGVRPEDQSNDLYNRVCSLEQEKRVLRAEVDALKVKLKNSFEENRRLRRKSVDLQAKAEQEEEFISNTLLKKIEQLKAEKETLALTYEQEEEYLTNELSRKLMQLRKEKTELEQTLEREQQLQVNKLMLKIEKLESETAAKQRSLEAVRQEKIDLENALEQEQEALVNRLWKRMEKLEREKRALGERLNTVVSQSTATSPSPSPASAAGPSAGSTSKPTSPAQLPASCDPPVPITGPPMDDPQKLSDHIQYLRREIQRLKHLHGSSLAENADRENEERQIRHENAQLRRKLELEVQRREQLCRHLSESESSLEVDESLSGHGGGALSGRKRTASSSPVPFMMAVSEGPSSGGTSRTRSFCLESQPAATTLSPLMSPAASPRQISSLGQVIVRCPACGHSTLMQLSSSGANAGVVGVPAVSSRPGPSISPGTGLQRAQQHPARLPADELLDEKTA